LLSVRLLIAIAVTHRCFLEGFFASKLAIMCCLTHCERGEGNNAMQSAMVPALSKASIEIAFISESGIRSDNEYIYA